MKYPTNGWPLKPCKRPEFKTRRYVGSETLCANCAQLIIEHSVWRVLLMAFRRQH